VAAKHQLTREDSVKGGQAAAALNMRNRTAIFGLSQDERTRNASNAGKVSGRALADSGKLAKIGLGIKTLESCARGGRAACHIRHHVNKNAFSPRCEFCSEHSLVIAFA